MCYLAATSLSFPAESEALLYFLSVQPAVGANGNVVREIGNYDHHLAQLRKLEERSQEPVSVPQSNHQSEFY